MSYANSDRGIDLRKNFKEAGFDCDPERDVFNQLTENALGNITWVCAFSECRCNGIGAMMQSCDIFLL